MAETRRYFIGQRIAVVIQQDGGKILSLSLFSNDGKFATFKELNMYIVERFLYGAINVAKKHESSNWMETLNESTTIMANCTYHGDFIRLSICDALNGIGFTSVIPQDEIPMFEQDIQIIAKSF